MLHSAARSGYTLIEMIVVLAALTILGAVLLPTLNGVSRDTKVKAGADIVRALVADGRGKAIETGLNYRLCISGDLKKVRVDPDPASLLDAQPGGTTTTREEELPAGVTIETLDEDPPAPDETGWIRVATILNDGTCREDLIELRLVEVGVQPIGVRIRGLTGSATLVELPNSGGARP